MSEYQYYEFLAVDRPLDRDQMDQVRALSSRARITATSFVNTYNWGDFRGDPRALMERYYDAFLYLANWGSRQVMLRLPADLLRPEVVEEYCWDESADHRETAGVFWVSGRNVILHLYAESEDDEWVEGEEDLLATIVGVRAELAAGDLRGLYLAWLLGIPAGLNPDDPDDLDPDDADEVEPPVPPGLATLTGAQRALADFLRIDEDLLAAAASASPPAAPGTAAGPDTPTGEEFAAWLGTVPHVEKDRILLRVFHDDAPQLRAELLRRFRVDTAGGGGPVDARADELVTGSGRRTVAELLAAARDIRADRERADEEHRVAERARRERAAAEVREQRLQRLAGHEEDAWRRVDTLIDTKRPADYDTAVALLLDLREVSAREATAAQGSTAEAGEQDGPGVEFGRRLLELRERHVRKHTLIDRLDRAGLTDLVKAGTGGAEG